MMTLFKGFLSSAFIGMVTAFVAGVAFFAIGGPIPAYALAGSVGFTIFSCLGFTGCALAEMLSD